MKIVETGVFTRWLAGLRDRRAGLRIVVRLERLADGNPGDYKALGGGLYEMRLTVGPGYRLYYAQQGNQVVILLVGGTKVSQPTDIITARRLLKEWIGE